MTCACVSPVYLRYIDSLGQQPDRLYLSTSLSRSSSSIRTRVHFLAPCPGSQHRQLAMQGFRHIHRKPDRCFQSRVLGVGESDCSPWMERGLVLLVMLLTLVLLARTMQILVLAVFPLWVMLWVLVRAMQRLVLLVVMQLPFPLYRRQTLPSGCPAVCVSWYSFQRSHDFLKQSAVLFARIWGRLTALHLIP